MAKAFSTKWKGGKTKVLNPGYHYNVHLACLIVPPGQVVTLYQNQDRTGFKSLPFYEGEYLDMDFYQDFVIDSAAAKATLENIRRKKHGFFGRNPGVVHVEKTDLRAEDLLTVWWQTDDRWNFKKTMKVPVGDRKAHEHFPNDKIDHLEIPFGMTAEVFADGFDRGSLIFSGVDEDDLHHVDLSDFRYNDKISNMRITHDDWELAGIAIENEDITESSEDKIGATIELANNSEFESVVEKTIGVTTQETTEENWNVGGSVTLSASVMGGYEAAGAKVEVTAGVEVEVHADYGQSKSHSKDVSFEDKVAVTIPKWGKAKASVIIEFGKMEADAVRKWRNKRTNAIIEERGHIKFNKANKTRVEVH